MSARIALAVGALAALALVGTLLLRSGGAPAIVAPAEVASWIVQLRDGDPDERSAAVAALAAIDHPAVVAPLVAAAGGDIQRHVRLAAVRALARPDLVTDPSPLIALLPTADAELAVALCDTLARLRATAAADPLAARAADREPAVRIAAVQALGRLGPAGAGHLDRLAATGTLEERVAIADVHGRSGDPARVPALLQLLNADDDLLRRTAAEALGRLRDAQAIAPLLALAHAPLSPARLAAFSERQRQGPGEVDLDGIRRMLDAELIELGRRPGADAHAWLNKPGAATEAFAKLLARQRGAAAAMVRAAAVAAIAAIGGAQADAALLPLIGAADAGLAAVVRAQLAQRDPPLLQVAARNSALPTAARLGLIDLLLGQAVAARVEPPRSRLADALRAQAAGSSTTDGEASEDAGDAGGSAPAVLPAALPPGLHATLTALLADTDDAVRARCAVALAVQHDPAAADPLLTLLDHADPALRLSAVRGLAALAEPRAVPALITAVADPASPVRGEAAMALGAIGDRAAVAPLLALARNRNAGGLRVTAVAALARLGDPAAGGPLLELWPEVARQSAERELQTGVIAALGALRTVDAVEPLLALLRPGQRPDHLLNAAFTSLGRLGDRRAVAPIIARLRAGPWHFKRSINYTMQAGLPALVALGDPAAVPFLAEVARQPPDAFSRTAAIAALGSLAVDEAPAALVALLGDPGLDAGIKEAAVAPALVAVGVRARSALLALLTDAPAPSGATASDAGLYAAQILALDAGALPALSALAADAGRPVHVLWRVLEALQRMDADDAATAAAGLLRHPEAQVRQWSAVALGSMRRPAAQAALVAAPADADPEVQRWIVWGRQQHGGAP